MMQFPMNGFEVGPLSFNLPLLWYCNTVEPNKYMGTQRLWK